MYVCVCMYVYVCMSLCPRVRVNVYVYAYASLLNVYATVPTYSPYLPWRSVIIIPAPCSRAEDVIRAYIFLHI